MLLIPNKEEKTNYSVKCPICRVSNDFSTLNRIYVNAKCTVCLTSEVEMLLPTCSHACLCIECCKQLNEYKTIPSYIPPSMISSRSISRSGSSSSSRNISFFPENDEGTHDIALERFGSLTGQIYTCIPAGLGCMFYYRRSNISQPLEKLFMHSDDWGQYGGTGRVPEFNNFILGYTQV